MKVKSSAKWKSIPLAHSFFTAGMDQGGKCDRLEDRNSILMQAVCGGIEELTDYTLVLKGSKSGKVWSLSKLLLVPNAWLLEVIRPTYLSPPLSSLDLDFC